jgi:hypothetical protein
MVIDLTSNWSFFMTKLPHIDTSLENRCVRFTYNGASHEGVVTEVTTLESIIKIHTDIELEDTNLDFSPYLIMSESFREAGGIPNACKEMKEKGQIYLKFEDFELIEDFGDQ